MSRVVLSASLIWMLAAYAVPLRAQQSEKIDHGIKVYAERKCMLCHAIAGKGNKKGALDDVGARLGADDIRKWITDPETMTEKTKANRKPAMKSLPDLSPADVEALVAYLQSLKKKPAS